MFVVNLCPFTLELPNQPPFYSLSTQRGQFYLTLCKQAWQEVSTFSSFKCFIIIIIIMINFSPEPIGEQQRVRELLGRPSVRELLATRARNAELDTRIPVPIPPTFDIVSASAHKPDTRIPEDYPPPPSYDSVAAVYPIYEPPPPYQERQNWSKWYPCCGPSYKHLVSQNCAGVSAMTWHSDPIFRGAATGPLQGC